MRTRPLLASLGAAVLVIGPSVAPAGAVGVTLGRAVVPTNTSCGGFTVVQTVSTSSYTAPAAGVVTSFSFVPGTNAPASVALRIARPAGAALTIVGASAAAPVAPGALTRADVRVPVAAGDLLGAYFAGPANAYCLVVAPGGTAVGSTGDTTSGTLPAPGPATGYDLALSATFEPDADGDGFGDLTQDLCPKDRSTQAVCGTGAPETTIGSVVAKKARSAGRKASVTAAFSANETSTFECAVDSPVFVPCTSPYAVKLTVGKHTLAVRATDAAGNVDRSAAVSSVKVKVAKPKKK